MKDSQRQITSPENLHHEPNASGSRRLNWKQARDMLGVGTTKFYELVNSGELKALRVGKRGLIIYEADVRALMRDVF